MGSFILVDVVVLALLALPAYYLLRSARLELAARRRACDWPTTAGTVLSGRVEERRALLPLAPGLLGRRHWTMFRPAITYRYQVGGSDYQCDHYRSGRLAHHRDWAAYRRGSAEEVVARHPAGAVVSVSYDPEDASRAYLSLDTDPGVPIVQGVVGGTLAIAFLAILALSVRSLQRQASAQVAANTAPPAIPLASDGILRALQQTQGMLCGDGERAAGQSMGYTAWECQVSQGEWHGWVRVFGRSQATTRVDMVRVQATLNDPDETVAFLSQVAAMCLDSGAAEAAGVWIASTAPALASQGNGADLTEVDPPLSLSNPFGSTLVLQIGGLK